MTAPINDILAERDATYGDFEEVSRISQHLKTGMQSGISYNKMPQIQQEALDMIANKLARICNGDSSYLDSWHDIIGYVTLVENYLEAPGQIKLDLTPKKFDSFSPPSLPL